MLNQGYILFVINMNLYAFFSIFTRFLNLIVNSKDWLMTLTLAMTLAHDLTSENQTNIYREKFFHTNKYKLHIPKRSNRAP